MNKQDIRTEAKKKRNSYNEDDIYRDSQDICHRIMELSEYKKALIVFCYMAIGSEVNLQALIEDAIDNNKIVVIPRIDKEKMEFYRISSVTDTHIGTMNIPEPDMDCMSVYDCYDIYRCSSSEALMIMPGLAFDIHHNRLGYGAGFYDRYISQGFLGTKVGVTYDFLIYEEIPIDIYDRKCDKIITEKRTI